MLIFWQVIQLKEALLSHETRLNGNGVLFFIPFYSSTEGRQETKNLKKLRKKLCLS